MGMLEYRPDIDGLRAVSVIAVILFHFNSDWLPGGFTGVDVFFVISGYLITGIIVSKLGQNTFEFSEFYVRRAKRILPASLFVVFIVVLAGLFISLPEDLVTLSESAIASVLSVANIYFPYYLDAGYFSPASDTLPLLHMWSLGVEEQFYIFWPAILVISYKFFGRQGVVAVSIIIAVASFLLSEYLLKTDPLLAYYSFPSRSGELVIGGLLFMLLSRKAFALPSWFSEVLVLSGVSLLGCSFVFIEQSDGFPGLLSLIPVVGTVFIIAGGYGKSTMSRLLAVRPLVFVGLISFSLYLWHWPVLAFYRYVFGEPTFSVFLIYVPLIIVLSYFSYRFVEMPGRKVVKRDRKLIFSVTGAALLTATVSYASINNEGHLGLVSPDGYEVSINDFRQYLKSRNYHDYNCQIGRHDPEIFEEERCVIGESGKQPFILVIGDSNAAHYTGYLKVIAEDLGIAVRNATHSACLPFRVDSEEYVVKHRSDSCKRYNELAFEKVKEYPVVFWAASWSDYEGRADSFWDDFALQLKELSEGNQEVVVALKAPELLNFDPDCGIKVLKFPWFSCSHRSTRNVEKYSAINDKIREIALAYVNVHIFSLEDSICDDGACSGYLDSKPIYRNEYHLSISGSEDLGRLAIDKGKVPSFMSRFAHEQRAGNQP